MEASAPALSLSYRASTREIEVLLLLAKVGDGRSTQPTNTPKRERELIARGVIIDKAATARKETQKYRPNALVERG
jgi:hypothetical protein